MPAQARAKEMPTEFAGRMSCAPRSSVGAEAVDLICGTAEAEGGTHPSTPGAFHVRATVRRQMANLHAHRIVFSGRVVTDLSDDAVAGVGARLTSWHATA